MYAGFGWSVSIYDDYAVISALGDNLARGAAYIFKRSNNNWIQEEKLTASDGDIQDWFGCSVSIFEDIIFIGANLDDDNAEDSGSAYVFVKEADNQPPVAPTINGPIKGLPLIPYQFTFTSTDPDGDDVSYYVDWGDGFITSWTPYQSSGSPGYSKSHSWTAFDVFTIKAKVKDINGLESAWTNYSFSTPRNRVINTVFVNFLGNHQNLFPILRHLLGL